MNQDTIAAVATPPGNGGISVIRISGSDAVKIADRVFAYGQGQKLSEAGSHVFHYGHAVFGDKIIDECMAVVMRAPRSYTREDCVEIHCHGGALVTKTVLEALFAAGAVPAEPGEFTKRAFFNGRIDLTEAEAVMDVIASENRYALDCSMHQLNGQLRKEISRLRQRILEETARIEAAIDDPEHYALEDYGRQLEQTLQPVLERIDTLQASFDDGRLLKEGIRTVIIGKPNAGKSSILNYLSGRDRAIVTEIPGTTRDTLEETIVLDGLQLIVTDTAGIHDTKDKVESIGIDKAKEAVAGADLVLFVLDSFAGYEDSDKEILSMIREKKTIVLLNKTDLEQNIQKEALEKALPFPVIDFSAAEAKGKEALGALLKEMLFSGKLETDHQIYITSLRQKNLLAQAKESLENVMESIRLKLPEDFYFIDLYAAYTKLGEISGDTVDEDIINEIFSKFCMGK